LEAILRMDFVTRGRQMVRSHFGDKTIAGLTFTVTQSADAACTYTVSSSSTGFQQPGGTGSVVVTAGAGCTWTAISNDSWITVTGGAPASGNGTVTYSVAPYTGRPRNRNGTMTIAGKTVSVKQSR
jgi:hypothetical protein